MRTHYKTINFSTRLEAQWAVFFDDLETAWEYKSRTFRLLDGTIFTPTFYLPGWNCIVEVKEEELDRDDLQTAKQMSHETGATLFYFLNKPGEQWRAVRFNMMNGEAEFSEGRICEDRRVPNAYVWVGSDDTSMTSIYCPPNGNYNDFAEKYPGGLGRVQNALSTAAQAVL